VTAFGAVPTGQMVHRMDARPGDVIYVSGTIGDAALGLALRLDPAAAWAATLVAPLRDHLLDRYLHPQPRLALGPVLRGRAHGGMDVSDGLVGDLAKMMAASGTAGTLHLERVPLSDAARAALQADPALIERIATGGDDYEILCTIPPHVAAAFEAAATVAGVPVTAIGEVAAGSGLAVLKDGSAVSFARGSFSHF
jgi:thiamine-monophosphate kinase